jgi:hypothetical protein
LHLAVRDRLPREANSMKYKFVSAVLMSALIMGAAAPADAAKKHVYQSSTQVKGYALHRGGYSYSYADSVNTYGGNQRRHIGPPTFREQTIAGPFDNGFFFDSAVSTNGGNAPYMH